MAGGEGALIDIFGMLHLAAAFFVTALEIVVGLLQSGLLILLTGVVSIIIREYSEEQSI